MFTTQRDFHFMKNEVIVAIIYLASLLKCSQPFQIQLLFITKKILSWKLKLFKVIHLQDRCVQGVFTSMVLLYKEREHS